jgi:DNA polymerase-3 subunit epsilon
MKFQLDRDLIFFDLEATGLNVIRDRIVQLAAVKYFADGREPEEISMLINPGIPISIEAMQVHGILPRDVANKPTFRQVADEIYAFFKDADLAGYNSNRFDIPMLIEEFSRVGIDFDMNSRRMIDVQRIFYKMEPRTLKAAVKFYCNENMKNAHDALADVQATVQVFQGQLERYKDTNYEDGDGNEIIRPIKNDMEAIHDFCNDLRFVDATQKLRYDENGNVVFNFGKYNNQLAGKVLYEDKQYYQWILNKEFSAQVKQAARQLVKEYIKSLK